MKFMCLINPKSRIMVLIAALFISAAAHPTATNAAYFELTAQVKSSFDKVKASTDNTQPGKMQVLYNDLLSIQVQDQQWDNKIPLLHFENEDTLIKLNKVTRLEVQVKQTRERYKPFFALYTSLNGWPLRAPLRCLRLTVRPLPW